MLSLIETGATQTHPGHLALAADKQSEPLARVEAFAAGDIVFWEDDDSASVFEVVEGVLRLCRLTPDGRRGITDFAYPGDLVGLGASDRYADTAEAVTKAQLRRHSRREVLSRSSQSPELSERLFRVMSDALTAAQNRVMVLSRMSAVERVAYFLLEVARKTGTERHVRLPVSRTDIADYLGLTIETVSRTLTRLKQAGLIALPSPQLIVLLAPAELKAIAELGEEHLPARRRAA
jgi:CRP/FNR family transcriptional regulator, anaerobic regulatory protein